MNLQSFWALGFGMKIRAGLDAVWTEGGREAKSGPLTPAPHDRPWADPPASQCLRLAHLGDPGHPPCFNLPSLAESPLSCKVAFSSSRDSETRVFGGWGALFCLPGPVTGFSQVLISRRK